MKRGYSKLVACSVRISIQTSTHYIYISIIMISLLRISTLAAHNEHEHYALYTVGHRNELSTVEIQLVMPFSPIYLFDYFFIFFFYFWYMNRSRERGSYVPTMNM